MSQTHTRVSLAYQDLSELPMEFMLKYGDWLDELDLTYNRISDLRFLSHFPLLSTLILDHNTIRSHIKLPVMSDLHTLWLNHNKVENLGVFIYSIAKSCPKLKYLSLMNNDAAPSYFNGGTYQQYVDYRQYVISQIPTLEILDDKCITDEERGEAEKIYQRAILQSNRRAKRVLIVRLFRTRYRYDSWKSKTRPRPKR
ncbi:leucine-rich melanocyte differentiation-associated protein [Octopus bimaculoides]|nr:leucine-rich melanocyte differentiation-associated protein [Octopus bimaculoides]|eukprot:XP_014776787.1 PREDICTED: leucine-rich repeat-containing protein C10orf11 homolog [Octopus bimaculoides]